MIEQNCHPVAQEESLPTAAGSQRVLAAGEFVSLSAVPDAARH